MLNYTMVIHEKNLEGSVRGLIEVVISHTTPEAKNRI
jgi:hypothetical protein